MKSLDELDGKIGEGFGGYSPNGAHLNVVLAKRGSPTAAAAVSMFAHPSPGHVPVLVVTGATQQDYEPVFPPTLMMNKATALEDHHQTVTWGAEGLLEPTQELLVLVAVWVEAAADDETALRKGTREGMLKAIRVAVDGRDRDRVRAQIAGRDSLQSPFYGGE
jgi:formaldehyde-activating enzyme involved in methanogenesis